MGRAQGIKDSFTGVFGDIRGLRPEQEKELAANTGYGSLAEWNVIGWSISGSSEDRLLKLAQWMLTSKYHISAMNADYVSRYSNFYGRLAEKERLLAAADDLERLFQNNVCSRDKEPPAAHYTVIPLDEWPVTLKESFRQWMAQGGD